MSLSNQEISQQAGEYLDTALDFLMRKIEKKAVSAEGITAPHMKLK